MEIRIAAIGNVDSAKSTTISCLSHDILDNGRGSARSKILKHKHEYDTGRTSSITQHYIKKADKVFCFTDLAGHQKYLKTTATGLSGCCIDYAMVTIGGDRGIIGMTKEHLQIAISLNIPTFIVITKIDISPAHKLQKILKKICKIMSSKAAVNKICYIFDIKYPRD
jgi:GTPase